MQEYTDEELAALEELGYDVGEGGYGAPSPVEKTNIFSFFKRVITMPDTTRTSNLTEDELGMVRIPVRTLLFLSLYSKQMGLSGLGDHFKMESNVITNSALSKEGFLDKLAVTQKREMVEGARKPPIKKGWFGKKGKGDQF